MARLADPHRGAGKPGTRNCENYSKRTSLLARLGPGLAAASGKHRDQLARRFQLIVTLVPDAA
jgi:hypothetical protein